MTAFLLVAVCAPVICIGLIHRICTLEIDHSLVFPVLDHICHILCKCLIGILSQIILIGIRVS